MSSKKFKVLILGAGSGGISMAARLSKEIGSEQIAIIDPANSHYYQPLWTLVGGGVVKKEESEKPMEKMIPKGVTWIKDRVESIDPTSKTVTCAQAGLFTFDYLIVATGLKLDWHKIKGVEGNLGKNGICSIYDYSQSEITFSTLKNFKGGTAIFTMPPVPIKCAGAPQKIMYLADEVFRKSGVREKTSIVYATAGKVIFGVPAFAAPLLEVAKKKSINVIYSHKLVEVDPQSKSATFEKTTEVTEDNKVVAKTERVEMPYDLIHVVPPMSAHDFIQDSGLAFTDGPQKGWLNVNQYTLQHNTYKYIFGIGDVTGVPNSKTGAAIRKQAPVVTSNILSVMKGNEPVEKYDGYSSCPLVTGVGKVILAEFGYDGKLMPSFPMNMACERWSMWVLKRHLLPKLYWFGMMKGKM